MADPHLADHRDVAPTGPPRLSGVLLGIGLGGFVDGIVLHQILQWHHLLTATGDHPAGTVAGLETNTLADGLFHLASWVFVLAGLSLMVFAWRQGRPAPPRQMQIGLLLIGWASFNLAEGLVDHHLLGLHNVRDDVAEPLWWNLGFLALSAALLAAGVALARAGTRVAAAPGQPPDRSARQSVAGRHRDEAGASSDPLDASR